MTHYPTGTNPLACDNWRENLQKMVDGEFPTIEDIIFYADEQDLAELRQRWVKIHGERLPSAQSH